MVEINTFCIREFQFNDIAIRAKCKESFEGHLITKESDETGLMIWPATFALCEYLLHKRELMSELTVLELGAGAGVVGLVASHFCSFCNITDGNEDIVDLLNENIELNVLNAVGSILKWGETEELKDNVQYDLILGSDIIYPAITEEVLKKLFTTVSLLLSSDITSKFIISFVRRDAKASAQRLLNIATEFSFGGHIIPWQIYGIQSC
mmetsp:Transcript_37728/g.47586  ORF Transcript_37728/g.47586 Transcript_37728/m.47586 type:complete len:208 (+) Transcript_37728:87-710(+)